MLLMMIIKLPTRLKKFYSHNDNVYGTARIIYSIKPLKTAAL